MAYHAPGNIDELSEEALEAWNAELSGLFAGQIAFARRLIDPDAGRAWLFDPIETGVERTVRAGIDWIAFPKRVSASGLPPRDGWKLVDDDRNRHEEYCEWEVARDTAGKVVRVTLTCETEDYYDFLFRNDQALLLDLYHRHVSPQVAIGQLKRPDGSYDPQNVWNFPQSGAPRGVIMHMGQRNNSFGAAVNLSAVATWPRANGAGAAIVGEQELIGCARFGEAQRHSDPHIGSEINKLVRAGNEVSFADPVGLYIDRIDLSDFEVPAGTPASSLMRVVRGNADHMLRVIFEAPAGSGFALGDVRIGGERIRFGSQVAEKTHIRIRGIARSAGEPAPLIGCDNRPAHQLLMAADLPPGGPVTAALSRLDSPASILSPE